MIQPLQRDQVLLDDIARARGEAGTLSCWWLGQSGFLIYFDEYFLLIDPYLSDSLSKKYDGTDKPHERISERVIDPARLSFVDLVTSSHNHTDHLDGETLGPMLAVKPSLKLLIPEANRDFVATRLGCDPAFPIGIDAGESRDIGPLRVTAVPAAHEAIDRDTEGRCVYLGYVIHCGPFSIYHSGDTIHYEGMEALLRPHQVDLALLPINGSDPARRVAGNLNGDEAATLAHAIGAGTVVPCHYDLFAFNTASPDTFEARCRALGQPFRTLRLGERVTLRS